MGTPGEMTREKERDMEQTATLSLPHVHRWIVGPDRDCKAEAKCECGECRILRSTLTLQECFALDHMGGSYWSPNGV